MSTAIDTRTTTTPKITDDGDHDRFQHYIEKVQISENLLNGTPMTALCGKVIHQQVDPKGRTICPTCQDIFENVVGTGPNAPKEG